MRESVFLSHFLADGGTYGHADDLTHFLADLRAHQLADERADVPHLLHFPGRSQLRRSSSMSVG